MSILLTIHQSQLGLEATNISSWRCTAFETMGGTATKGNPGPGLRCSAWLRKKAQTACGTIAKTDFDCRIFRCRVRRIWLLSDQSKPFLTEVAVRHSAVRYNLHLHRN